MNRLKRQLNIALCYFLAIQIIGLFLRGLYIFPVSGVNFKYVLHGHSHIALLGWVFTVIFVAYILTFLSPEQQEKKVYDYLFIGMQISLVGMLVTFPLVGYKPISIIFSTLHILLSYGFAWHLLKDLKHSNTVAVKWVRWSIFFMLLSSLGPWTLGPLVALKQAHTPLYYLAIYFYLHFQYNGWFTFASFALFFQWVGKQQVTKRQESILNMMVIATLSGFLLSALWLKPTGSLYMIGFGSAVIQIFAFIYCLPFIRIFAKHSIKNKGQFLLGAFVLACYGLKVIFQLVSAVPIMAEFAYLNRNIIIGYIHLVFLGFISLYFIFYFIQIEWWSLSKKIGLPGLFLFVSGFVLSEGLLFIQPVLLQFSYLIPNYYFWLFISSAIMPIGTLLFLIDQMTFKESSLINQNLYFEKVKI